MEESLSSGLPSGWEQGAPVAGWGAANIPAGYGTVQPPPGYPLIQQHPHSPYGAADLSSRYGAAGSPIPYGATDPAAAYRVLPGPIGYDAVNLHSRYGGLIDSSQDYRRTIPHSLYEEKGHNSGYSTPDHAIGYAHPEYEKSEPSSVYGRSDNTLHYETAGSHSPYHRSEPTSDFARTDPARGYDRRETHPEYEKIDPQPGYERVEPSGYCPSDHVPGRATTDSHARYEKSVPTTEYDTTERGRVYDTIESQSGYMNAEHPGEFERSHHKSAYEKSEHLSEYDVTNHPSDNERSEHKEHEHSEHLLEYNRTDHPSDIEMSKHKEHEHSEHLSEYDRTEHHLEKEMSDHKEEYEKSDNLSEYDTAEHLSEKGKTYSTEFEKTESSEYMKSKNNEHPSKHDIIDSTKENDTEKPASEYERTVSHSAIETSNSSSVQGTVDSPPSWNKPDLPPGWERKCVERQNGATDEESVDIYYVSPTGKKLYSKPEVIQYCQDEGFEVDLKLFRFNSSNTQSPIRPSDCDKTENASKNYETEHSSEFNEAELVKVKEEKPDNPPEQEIPHSTEENDTEGPASESESVGASHSIFETGDSSSAWGNEDSTPAWTKSDLPPGWVRNVVERQNGVSGAKKRVDIYYISPTGKKLRSKPDVVKYCQEEGLEVDLQLFGFSLKKIGSPAMPGSPAQSGEASKTPSGRGRPRGRGKPKGASTKKGRSRNEQEIEKILDHREASGGDTMYFVKWFGYTDSYNTWEDLSSLGPDAADHIEHYWAHKEAQSQINQDILHSIMQIHSNGAEESNDHVEPEEQPEIPSYFPQHFLSSSFYEESEPVKSKGKGKAKRGRPRGSSRGGSSPVVKQIPDSGRGRAKGRPRKHPPNPPNSEFTSGFNTGDSTEGAAASSDAMDEGPGHLDADFSAALQCETVMQEGNQENQENQENLSVSQETESGDKESEKPVEQEEKKDDTPPETVIVPELADKPRCLILDKVPNKMHEKEIDVIVAHQTKGVKETKYFVRYFTTLDKENKQKGHAWIFDSELKNSKEMLDTYWAKRNAKDEVKTGSSTATSQRSMQQVNNVGRPAGTKPSMMPASKKNVEIIDLSDDEGDGKKNMAKPSQPLGQQRKQQVSTMSSWHTPQIEETSNITQQEEYQVERIMLHRKRNGKTQYLVKWKDYPQSEATWEPEENLKNCKSILDAYHKRKIEKVVFHRDLGGKREYLIKWEGFFSRHNSWETSETCSHLRDFQTHVNEYWRRKQEEADRKKRNLEECQQYYNTVKERENREKRPRVDSAADSNKEWVIDSLCKTRDDDMEPSFLIKLCLLNTAINSLRCDRCGQQTLKFIKSGESLLSELSIKCTACPDIRHFSTSKPSTNEPFLDIGGGEYIPLEINPEAQPVIVPIPVPIKRLNKAKCPDDTKTENTSSGNTKITEMGAKSDVKNEMEVDESETSEIKTALKTEVDDSEKKEMEKGQDSTRISSGTSIANNNEKSSCSSSDVTNTDGNKSSEMAASRSTSTTQSSTTNLENSNVQQNKEQLPGGCESNLEISATKNKDATNPESISLSHNLNKETKETESSSKGASELTAIAQSVDVDDDDDDIIMTEPEDPLCL